MYLIFLEGKGFLCENIDETNYEFEISDCTVTFDTLEEAIENCDDGEIVLKIEHRSNTQQTKDISLV